MLAGYRITFRVTAKELAEIKASLERLPKGIRGKVLRTGLRGWGEEVKRAVRAKARRKDVRTRRSIIVKTKTYKRGKVIWCGIGVRKGGPIDVGWKSHLHDQGYRPWRKGIKADGWQRHRDVLQLERVGDAHAIVTVPVVWSSKLARTVSFEDAVTCQLVMKQFPDIVMPVL